MKPAKQSRAPASKRRKKAADLPRRALSAYNIFFREMRGRIMEEQKRDGVSSASTFGALGRAVAERWKKVTPQETKRYNELAAEDRKRYNEEMNLYKTNALAATKKRLHAGELLTVSSDRSHDHPHSKIPSEQSTSGPQQSYCSLRIPGEPALPTTGRHALSHASQESTQPTGTSNSLDFCAQDQLAYAQLLAVKSLYGSYQCPPAQVVGFGGLYQPQPPLLLLNPLFRQQQVALAVQLEAERGHQFGSQTTQQLLQNAIANQRYQLALAQQASFASTMPPGSSDQSHMPMLFHGLQQQQLHHFQQPQQQQPPAGYDPLLGIMVPAQNGTNNMPLDPQLAALVRQIQQNRESGLLNSGGAQGPHRF